MTARAQIVIRGLLVAIALGAPATSAAPAATPAPAPRLLDVTDAAGLDFVHQNGATGRRYLPETMGSGGAAFDYDGDGWTDLYFVQAGDLTGDGRVSTNRLYRGRRPLQQPDGVTTPQFEDVTERAHAGGHGYGQGALAADFDGDGWTDLYLTNLGANVLLHNRGDGTFVDVTEAAGVGDPAWSSSAVAFDADRDGDLDLYVVNYLDYTVANHRDCRRGPDRVTAYCHPDAYPSAADRFYRNRGDGTFVDATEAVGLTDESGKGLGAVAADFDHDGWVDLYVANDSTPNFLYRNLGGMFEEVALFWGVGYNEEGHTEAGMGVDTGDVDGDGQLDLFVTNLSLETNALYLGGDGMFTYATRAAGLHAPSLPVLGFGTDLLDVDNDGDLDILVANGDVLDNVASFNDGLRYRQPSQLFLNDGAGRFQPVSNEAAGPLATPRVGRGTMTFDADHDGRLDVALVFNNDRARLVRNMGPAGHWVVIELTSVGSQNGVTGNGVTGNGVTGNGVTGNGVTGNGVTGNGVTGNAGTQNRHGIGATISLETADRRQRDAIKAGSSYASSSVPEVHFGLGAAPRVPRMTVLWPDGRQQTILDLKANARYRLSRPPGSSDRSDLRQSAPAVPRPF